MSRLLSVVGLTVAVTLAGCVTVSDPFDRGVALYRDGNYAGAIAAFTLSISRSPGVAASYTNRGVARVRAGDVSGALADYTQALQLAPGDAETYFDRGNAYVLAGDHVSAIADFTRAIELAPGYARAYFNRGTARARVGDRAGALLDWHAAIDMERDPWARAGMERSAGMDVSPAAAVPLTPAAPPPDGILAPPQPLVALPPGAAAPPPPVMSAQAAAAPVLTPMPAQDMDARSLANRAISREIDGDHPGAVADLSAAILKESDPARRASMEHLLQLLQSPR
jgi:tetratricopeptide (TPR) repeat protein